MVSVSVHKQLLERTDTNPYLRHQTETGAIAAIGWVEAVVSDDVSDYDDDVSPLIRRCTGDALVIVMHW